MKVLVPTDGSESALRAAKFAAKIRQDVHITLMSVHDDAGLKHLKKYVPKDSISDYLRAQAEKDLKPAHQILNKYGIAHDLIIKTGHVVEEILKVGQAENYDLIVMGAKGRGGLLDLLIGSVAQRVLGSAKQPVLLVK